MNTRRFLILLSFILLPMTSTWAQTDSFQSFLSSLRHVSTLSKGVDERDSTDYKLYNKPQYSPFLPDSIRLDIKAGEQGWQCGCYTDWNDLKLARLTYVYWGAEDGFERDFVEYDLVAEVLIIYTPEGEIIDHCVLAVEGHMHRSDILFSENYRTCRVRQICLQNPKQLHEYTDLDATVSDKIIKINNKGKISIKPGKAHTEKIAQQVWEARNTTFGEFLSLFKPWSASDIDYRSLPFSDQAKSYEEVSTFIPENADCNCWPRDLLWAPCYMIEQDNFILCYVVKYCDYPKTSEPYYTEHLLLAYDRKGQLIDFKIIAHDSDDHPESVRGKRQPLQFEVLSPNSDNAITIWGVTDDGHIKVVSEHSLDF